MRLPPGYQFLVREEPRLVPGTLPPPRTLAPPVRARQPLPRALQRRKLGRRHAPPTGARRKREGQRGRLDLANGRQEGARRKITVEFLPRTPAPPVPAPEFPPLEGANERLDPARRRRAGAFPVLHPPRHVQPGGSLS